MFFIIFAHETKRKEIETVCNLEYQNIMRRMHLLYYNQFHSKDYFLPQISLPEHQLAIQILFIILPSTICKLMIICMSVYVLLTFIKTFSKRNINNNETNYSPFALECEKMFACYRKKI